MAAEKPSPVSETSHSVLSFTRRGSFLSGGHVGVGGDHERSGVARTGKNPPSSLNGSAESTPPLAD